MAFTAMTTPRPPRIDPSQLRTWVKGMGGCLATDRITVEGARVGYMERGAPVRPEDSGWQFLAGDETRAYLDDRSHVGVHDLNTICNYDPDIVPLLGAPPGSAFERRAPDGPLLPCEGTAMPAPYAGMRWPPPGYPLVSGDFAITDEYRVVLPDPFTRRVDGGSLVLWRPGITLWIDAFGNDHEATRSTRAAEIRGDVSAAARDVQEAVLADATYLRYRLHEDGQDSLMVFVITDRGHLQMAVYYDLGGDAPIADEIARSVRAA